MKGSGKIILMTSVVTSAFLLYVHLQASLLHISYEINSKSQVLAQKAEQYRHLNFEVNSLKSPHRLETKMRELEMDLMLPKDIEVLRIDHRELLPEVNAELINTLSLPTKLMSYFERFVGVAQAKTEA